MIILKSCGFKWGQPNANFYFDVSFFINPWRKKELRDASKQTILKFMKEQEGFEELTDIFVELISTYYRLWSEETLVFAFCCSAGKFRSPAIVKSVAKELKKRGIPYELK